MKLRSSQRAAAVALAALCVVWAGDRPRQPLGLPPVEWPKKNPYSAAKVELGKLLYFDKRLSADGTISCATCHDPEKGWTDNRPVSSGIHGQKGSISAPTVVNATYMALQF